jgi:hypothetical protein
MEHLHFDKLDYLVLVCKVYISNLHLNNYLSNYIDSYHRILLEYHYFGMEGH